MTQQTASNEALEYMLSFANGDYYINHEDSYMRIHAVFTGGKIRHHQASLKEYFSELEQKTQQGVYEPTRQEIILTAQNSIFYGYRKDGLVLRNGYKIIEADQSRGNIILRVNKISEGLSGKIWEQLNRARTTQ